MLRIPNLKYFGWALVLTLASCEKASVTPATPNPMAAVNQAASARAEGIAEGVSVIEGRLVFANNDAFVSTMKQLQEYNTSKLADWDAQNGIKSLSELYTSINNSEKSEQSAEDLIAQGKLLGIPDDKFASVVNTDGVFQVGDQIHKITQNEELIYPATGKGEAKHFPIEFKFASDSTGAGAEQARSGNFYGWYEREIYNDASGRRLPTTSNGRATRMVAVQWNVTYYLYSSAGVRTKYQYKPRFWFWSGTDASNLHVDGSFDVTVPDPTTGNPSPPFTVAGSDDDTNTSSVSKNLVFVFSNNGTKFTIVTSTSHHSAVYRGATASETL